MNKKYPLYIFIFCLILLNLLFLFSALSAKNKQDNYFRLHVVANSNSIDDQIIKLNITKKINNYLTDLYNNTNFSTSALKEKDSAKKLVSDNIFTILEIANSELNKHNASYSCHANIGRISYEEKNSDIINMNEGIYDSIQIVLGSGDGENFWSLIFPYSYNTNFDITKGSDLENSDIQIKSGIIETLKKVVKTFSS